MVLRACGITFICVLACSAHSGGNPAGDPVASTDCTEYLATYRGCLEVMASPSVVDKRVEALRASLQKRDATGLPQFCAQQRRTLAATCR